MTTKEKLVELLQNSGYDTITACRLVDSVIKEIKSCFEDSPLLKQIKIIVGGYCVIIEKDNQ